MTKTIHFLHIGKTGGSAIKEALKRAISSQDDYKHTKRIKDNVPWKINQLSAYFDEIILHGHGSTLHNIPDSDFFFLCIRNPISRYVSGFYSRKRQGRPRYNIPWTSGEEKAFKLFETPNELGEALTSSNEDRRRSANKAFKSIRHVKTSLAKWTISKEFFKSRESKLVMILRQETLSTDFKILLKRMQIKQELKLSSDSRITHKSDTLKDNTDLSKIAIQNITDHYRKDISIYNWLLNLEKN